MRATTHACDRAIGKHYFQSQHIIGGDPVLETAWTAGVGRHVSAYAAIRSASRIRRIVQSFGLGLGLKIRSDYSRLGHGHEIVLMDFLDPSHARDRKGYTAA